MTVCAFAPHKTKRPVVPLRETTGLYRDTGGRSGYTPGSVDVRPWFCSFKYAISGSK
jgi:hypothetical protein